MTTSGDRDPALQELLDKQAIHENLMRYCRGIDRCDADLVKSAYHADSYDDHGGFKGNGWEFASSSVDGLRMFSATQHAICNELIELDGDTAHREAYFLASHRLVRDGATVDLLFAGRYVDRLERRDGEWRIACRVVVHDWSRIDEVKETFPGLDQFVHGRRAPDDLVYHPSALAPPPRRHP